ncbi:ATP-dependent DNA helicase DinG [Comamonas serinivorans]|uniref:ATP-dependent DNA helicase DinG n=1 Tax=Comamonas serinivorans TaxID=1082851 RepID=A0A1Y0EJX9_9BURK|nr:ATP-dependent DNA helicase DinG [Comamonas serinivorans]ARU03669.1 ATP-dependent DNA helicase DinG [Comamonas serinivorans]
MPPEPPRAAPAPSQSVRAQGWQALALSAFDEVVQASSGFMPRAGQRQMAEHIAHTLSLATLPSDPADSLNQGEPVAERRAIAVIQAGTGVGKSLAYSATAIAMALARGTRVVISTATVALQEQLVNKDLPALAERLPGGFRYALAKGRGRYVCKFKLERLAAGADATEAEADAEAADDLFGDDPAFGTPVASLSTAERQARVRFYSRMADVLAAGQWDGDRDSLEVPPAGEVWQPVAAVSQTCTGRHCPAFASCVYYERRKALVNAQVIVANHDLLLSSIGSRLLPELGQCLLIFDEAHHLPATALDQFATRADLNRSGWVDTLASRAQRVGGLLGVGEVTDVSTHAQALTRHLRDAERLVSDLFGAQLTSQAGGWGPPRVRLPLGALPEVLAEPVQRIEHHANGFLTALRAVAKALKADIKDKPDEARRLSTLYAQIGMLAPRLEELAATASSLLHSPEEGAPPMAKWITLSQPADERAPDAGKTGRRAAASAFTPVLSLHASPILPSVSLHHRLWKNVSGAILTSATMTSLGKFDFFLRDAGLAQDAAVTTLAVESPFDFARQGELIAAATQADPRQAERFNAEMCTQLMRDLQQVKAGALVLFTSRAQLTQAVAALPPTLRSRTLVQTELPRSQLLQQHRDAVAKGQPSIIFGMQSFGEGLDLPGALCESLFITKLPFAPPDEPVSEARAEWLRSIARDPFIELVVPATAIRLAQWMGRAIRTEADHAQVTCYDKRLTGTSYGQQLLKGVPPFRLVQRGPG